jgi:hypothetical protein
MSLALVADVGAQTSTTTTTTDNTRAVGGVSIDARGMLRNLAKDESGKLQRVLAESLQPVPSDMNQWSDCRKVSLRALEAEIQKSMKSGKPVPDAVACLAGLQKIQYVLAYPEKNDIVLVGSGEGWKLGAHGAMVGATTGQPVLLLDDLVTVLRASVAPSKSVMSCSINPTPEGVRRVEAFAKNNRTLASDPNATEMLQKQLGPQTISITGVPATSHFASVMVAADYRMKRISMDFEPSPVRSLPSFMSMVRSGSADMMPRFWLQPDYKGIVRDPKGMAYELQGAAVSAMSENDYCDAAGVAHPTGKTDPISQRWAGLMTKNYDALSKAEPVFGQLRGCMDLAVVGALMVKENLLDKVQNPLPLLTGRNEGLQTAELSAPKKVASEASLVKKGRKTLVAAGGVEINPWAAVAKVEEKTSLSDVRQKQASKKDNANWWWD